MAFRPVPVSVLDHAADCRHRPQYPDPRLCAHRRRKLDDRDRRKEGRDFGSKNKIPYYEIPEIHSPRTSFSCYLYSILNVLEDVIPVKKQDIKESISLLMETKKKISSTNLTNSNPALSLAKWISDFPIIYYPWGLHSAAIRFKNSLQENAKIHVFAEDVIESSHNGIVAWEKRSKIKPILIIGKDDYTKTKERWQGVKKFYNLNKIQ